MPENIRSSTDNARTRIAAAQAARVRTDAQGNPLTPPTTYTYDETGRLIAATPSNKSSN